MNQYGFSIPVSRSYGQEIAEAHRALQQQIPSHRQSSSNSNNNNSDAASFSSASSSSSCISLIKARFSRSHKN